MGQRRNQLHRQGRRQRQCAEQAGKGQAEGRRPVLERPAQQHRVGAEGGVVAAVERPVNRPQQRTERLGQQAPCPQRPAHRCMKRRRRQPAPGGQVRRRSGGRVAAEANRRQHGDKRERQQQRSHQREGDGQRLIAKQLAGDALDEGQGQEHGDGGQGGGQHGAADLAGALPGRLGEGWPKVRFAVAGDVLQHHDGVVHQHAHRQGDAAEAHDVQGDVEGVHQHEGGQHRDRDGHGDDQGAAHVLQEEVEHDHREEGADDGRRLHFVDGRRDEGRLVVDLQQPVVRGHVVGELLKPLVDGRRHRHGVRVAFLVQGDLDGLGALHAHDAVALLVALLHLRQVLQPQNAAALLEDDGVADVFHGLELVHRPHQVFLAAIGQPPAGEIDVGRQQALAELLHVHADLRQTLLIDVDRHFVLVAAADQHGGNARHRIQALLHHLLGEAAQLLQRGDAVVLRRFHQRDGGADDGVEVRIQAQNGRAFDVQRQLHEVQFLAHLHGGVVHVRAPGELQHQIRAFGGGNRVHAAHAVDDANALFEAPGDLLFHLAGRRALEVGAHGEGRIGEFRQQIQAQPVQGQAAEKGHGQGRHGDGDAPGHRSGDDAHGTTSAAARNNVTTRAFLETIRPASGWQRRAPACRRASPPGRSTPLRRLRRRRRAVR